MSSLKLETLLNISQVDLTTPLNQLLDEILTTVGREMQAHSGSVMLVNEETGELDIAATFGLPGDYIDRINARGVLNTCSLSGEVLKTGKFYEVPNIFEESRDKWWADLGRDLGFSAQLFMPMKHNGRTIGLLNIYMAEPHEYTRDEIAFVSIAASQAAAMIEHARLYATIEKEKTKLESEVTEHKRVEELLWASKEVLSNILSASPIGIGIVKERKLNWTNDRMLDMMGFKPNDDPYEYVGQSAEVIYASKEEYERVGQIFYEGLKRRDLVEVDAKLKRKDGSLFDAHIIMSFLDPSNPHKGAIATISDISWRKQAEEALQESEEKYRGLAENLQDGLFILQGYPYPELKFCNEAFAKMAGYTIEEMMEMTIQRYVAPEDLERVADNYRRRLDGKDVPREYEYRVLHKDGKTPVYVNMHAGLMEYQGTKATQGTVKDITKHKRVEKALQQSEEMYRTLFENTGTAMMIIEDDMTISLINAEMEAVSGYSKGEIEGLMKWTDFVPNEDLERMKGYHRLRRVDPEVAPKSYEFQFIHKNGDLREAFLTATLIPGTTQSVISIRDITEKKRLEEELQRSEVLYRTFFEVTNAPTVILNEDGTFYKVNQEGAKISGFTKEELEGKKSWTEFIGRKEDLEKMKKIHRLRRDDPDNAPGHYEFLFKDRYGNLRNISVAAALIPGTKRSAVSFMDVTERKRVEEALRESEDRFHSLFDNLSVGIAMIDWEGQVLAVNKTACRFLDYSQEELIGMQLTTLIYPKDLEADREPFKPVIEGKEDHCLMDKRCVRKDGEIVWGRLHVSGIKDEEGHVKFMSIICEDITACKLVEKALLSKSEEMASVVAKCKHMKEALQRSETKYKEIAEFLPDLIYKSILLDA
jgi:PAS domain S-box-containing protein